MPDSLVSSSSEDMLEFCHMGHSRLDLSMVKCAMHHSMSVSWFLDALTFNALDGAAGLSGR